MKPSLWQRMDLAARNMVPVVLTLALLLLSVAPTRIPAFAGVAPMLALMGVFYWSIARPDLMTPLAAFAIGLLLDILAGTPIGVSALVLLLVHGSVVVQRKFFLGKPFYVWWGAFALVAAGAALAKWVLLAVLFERVSDGGAVAVSCALTVVLYPLVGWAFARLESAVVREA